RDRPPHQPDALPAARRDGGRPRGADRGADRGRSSRAAGRGRRRRDARLVALRGVSRTPFTLFSLTSVAGTLPRNRPTRRTPPALRVRHERARSSGTEGGEPAEARVDRRALAPAVLVRLPGVLVVARRRVGERGPPDGGQRARGGRQAGGDPHRGRL